MSFSQLPHWLKFKVTKILAVFKKQKKHQHFPSLRYAHYFLLGELSHLSLMPLVDAPVISSPRSWVSPTWSMLPVQQQRIPWKLMRLNKFVPAALSANTSNVLHVYFLSSYFFRRSCVLHLIRYSSMFSKTKADSHVSVFRSKSISHL